MPDPGDPDLTQSLPTAAEMPTLALSESDQTAPSGAPTPAGGRFQIVREHRRGGLGRVYVARDLQLGREVALKEILGDHADDPISRVRFLLEAEVTGNLEHPGFVPVYALGHHDDGRPYYAMRLIRGITLKEAIQNLRLDPAGRPIAPRAAELTAAIRPLIRRLVDVCNALAYAHSRGVIHRDVKPANILLGPYGETLVVDWGLAKIVGSSEHSDPPPLVGQPRVAIDEAEQEATFRPSSGGSSAETLPGRAVGTPAFMSPEQARGALEELGPASDIYSLGATLFHLLTGRLPFNAEGAPLAEILQKVERGDLRHPRSIDPGVPRALEAVCLKAMALRPEDRYPSMTAFARDLERWIDDEPVTALRESWSDRLTRWGRRHKAWAGTLAAALLAIVGILAFTANDFRRVAEREHQAREQSLRVAAKFAARTVAAEIDRRWRILENEAIDPELSGLLQGRHEPADSPARMGLQHWVEIHFAEHDAAAAASNWFVTDERGVQIARAPYIASNIGVDYNYRDYFHGQGRDLPPGTPDLSPITRPHRSIVFRSKATQKYTVVFSVPVHEGGDPQKPVVAVLGMSVDVGHFGVLQLDVGDNQLAVLADVRTDFEGRTGLILHHADLSPSSGSIAYLDPDRTTSLQRLREASIARLRKREQDRAIEEPVSRQRSTPLPGTYEEAYRDPIDGPGKGIWHAAFEPILIEGRPEVSVDTGWVVIVQERPDPDEENP